ncbi:hypothetical protein SAMN05192559_11726 [Halobacillus karajensis]|uniref:hypothetical protein n=1 Tax=Halobacillus karajensis TaxID=195088 RepID=UPI0008A7F1E3|nr:hypothetical protein [Halobacillus karajensis]SEI13435.1 hypothetical protein SAMN05192559_11726 [Halobacillus karajensis]
MLLAQKIENLMVNKNPSDQNLERNIQIVLNYFGLGKRSSITLESIGKKFGMTRQAIQQTIDNKFLTKVRESDLQEIYKIRDVLHAQDYMFSEEFIEELAGQKILEKGTNVKGVLRLLRKFNTCNEFDIYNLEIERASNNYIENASPTLILNLSEREILDRNLLIVKSFLGRSGICELNNIFKIKNLDLSCYAIIKKIISSQQNTWFYNNSDEFWYIYEDRRDNALINIMRKLVNVTNSVNVEILSEVMTSVLRKRSGPNQPKPPNQDVIFHYLINSKYIKMEGKYCILDIDVPKNLTPIQQDIVELFTDNKSWRISIENLKKSLMEKGHTIHVIRREVYHSPLIFIDKHRGRGSYFFIFVKSFAKDIKINQKVNSYSKTRRLLVRLHGRTNYTTKTKKRREQSILRAWLLGGKDTDFCALCNRKFTIHSLIAAHKKKRSICNEEERTDPHIVMPLCKFGCDHVYEEGLVKIDEDGNIIESKSYELQKVEINYISNLTGNRLNKKWLLGDITYFK